MSDKGTRVAGLVYLGWQCQPGQSPAEGLPEALARYQARTGQLPRALVVRQRDSLPAVDLEIVVSSVIPADCIGMVVEGETGQAGGRSARVPDDAASTDKPAVALAR
jgi:hypothetical protein